MSTKRGVVMQISKVSCLGETRLMKNGMQAKCITYRLANDIDIQFEDGTTIEHTQKVHFYAGTVINPNSKYNPYKSLDFLALTNPELIKEWDFEKNEISPNEITRSFNKKVWWKCEKGHCWQATPRARTRVKGTGCPYCSGNLAIEGENDFETSNPELMLDWDWTKNKSINPRKMTANSGIYVNWKCHFCGFEWKTAANNRSSAKHGCPNCSMKSTSFGEQSLFYYVKMIYPNAINRYRDGKFELDIYIPDIKVGIEFDGAFFHKGVENNNREKKKYYECQRRDIKLIRLKDSNQMKSIGNSDYTIGVENLKNFDSLNKAIRMLLKDLDSKSNFWIRKNPMQIYSSIDQEINVKKDYFDIVSDKFVREESNSFVNTNPELLEDWDYELNRNVNPRAITRGSGMQINWKCHICGYKWKARVPDRIKGTGCPCCNRNVLVKGINDFATLYPLELAEWDYENNVVQPDQVISYNKKINWICSKCGYKWAATINDKVIRKDKTGCPNCARKSIANKRHLRAMNGGGLFEKYPELLKSWNYNMNKGIDINDISSGSSKRYWWKCPECNYEWEASPNNRTHGGRVRNCPKCRYRFMNKK